MIVAAVCNKESLYLLKVHSHKVKEEKKFNCRRPSKNEKSKKSQGDEKNSLE